MQHMKSSWRVGPAPSKRKESGNKRASVTQQETWKVVLPGTWTHSNAKDCVAATVQDGAGVISIHDPADYVLIPGQRKASDLRRRCRKREISSKHPLVFLVNHPALQRTSDPFSTTPIKLTGLDHDIIRTFRALFLHSLWPINLGTDCSPILEGWEQQTSTALTSKSCTNALLFTSTIWTRSKYIDQAHRSTFKVKSIKHQVASLESLRVELDYDRPKLSSIIAIVLLSVGLAISGDNAAGAIHFRGLRPLVEAYGGLLSLPYPVRAMILSSDHATAVAEMRPIVFSSDQWDPGFVFGDLSVSEKQQYWGTLHSCLPLSDEIPPHMSPFFASQRDWLAVHEVALQTEDRTRRTDLLHWTLVRYFVELPVTQDQRCVLMGIESKGSSLSQETALLALETSVRIAAQYLNRLVFYPRPGDAPIFADFDDIQYWLDKPMVRRLAPKSTLLWLLATAACLERNLRMVQYRRRWHAPRFLLLARHMGLETTEAVSMLMQKFLYAKVPLEDHIEYLLAERDDIYQDTNCTLGLCPGKIDSSEGIDYIWDVPDRIQAKRTCHSGPRKTGRLLLVR